MTTIEQIYKIDPDLQGLDDNRVAHLVEVFCTVAPTIARLTPIAVATWVRHRGITPRIEVAELQALARAEIDVRTAMTHGGSHA